MPDSNPLLRAVVDTDAAAAPPGGALHEDLVRAEEIVGPSDRRFGLTIAIVCAAIGGIRIAFGHRYWGWWLGAGLLFALTAMCWPAALAPLNRAWLRLGLALHRIVSPLVMALMFFSTMAPIGLLMRLCGQDPLRLRRDPAAASYWLVRDPPGPPPASMRNQF